MKHVDMYISCNPCRERSAILQQMFSQVLCTERMPIKKYIRKQFINHIQTYCSLNALQ